MKRDQIMQVKDNKGAWELHFFFTLLHVITQFHVCEQ